MISLPIAVERCTIPSVFSPSQLAVGEPCLLRVVLAATRDVQSLTAHPAAAIGSAFHELLELAARGQIQRRGTAEQDVASALESLIDEKQTQLAQMSGIPATELRSVLPPLIWRRKRRAVLDLAARYLSSVMPSAAPSGPSRSRVAKDLPVAGKWPEVWLEDLDLRLRGRVDVLERTPGQVVIRDLKTGRVRDKEGELHSHITRQMRLYGLVARALWPTVEIRLVVEWGTELDVAFGPDDQEEVRAWLTVILDRVPAGESMIAESLAVPGQACEGCSYRHVCSSYHAFAPKTWRSETAVRMPLDVWGKVVEMTPQSTDRYDVRMMDAAKRTVKIFGLARSHVEGLSEGDNLWLFGLRTRERRGGPESYRQPLNFFESSDDDPYAHAWALQSFGSAP